MIARYVLSVRVQCTTHLRRALSASVGVSQRTGQACISLELKIEKPDSEKRSILVGLSPLTNSQKNIIKKYYKNSKPPLMIVNKC